MRVGGVAVVLMGCTFQHGNLGSNDAPTADVAMPDTPGTAPTSPRIIDIDSTSLTTNVTNIPVLVTLDSSSIDYSKVATPASDLRFHDVATEADLPFEIDTWNSSGTSYVWIKAPTLRAGQHDQVRLDFGSTAGGAENPHAVWSNSFELVHHFSSTLTNSALNAWNGTLQGATLGAGTIGTAATFTGTTNERVTFGSDGSLLDGYATFTVDFWIRPDYASSSEITDEPHFMEKGGSLDLPRLFVNPGPAVTLQIDFNFTGAGDVTLNTDVPLQVWTHIMYTYDTRILRLFKNGVQARMQDLGSTQSLNNASNTFYVGSSGAVIAGGIDELHVSPAGRPGSWAKAVYLSEAGQSVTIAAP